jgi:hypothetical protein
MRACKRRLDVGATPTDPENEYFKLKEIRKLKRAALDAARETKADERTRLKEQHWMRCPKCGMKLDEIEFRGVTVDTCFNCEGMFFDLGEVDKMLEWKEPGLVEQMVTVLFRTGFTTS